MPTFAQLKTRVKDYLIDVPTKTDTLVGAWINKAIQDAEKRHNFQHMQDTVEATTSDGVESLVAIPARWKEMRAVPFRLLSDGSYDEVGMITGEEDYHRQFTSTKMTDRGEPRQLYLDREDDDFKLLPIPDDQGDFGDDYKFVIPYWRYSVDLSADSDTNWFTDNAEWYLTFAAAGEGMLFNRDHQEASIMFQRATTQQDIVVAADKRTATRRPRQLVPRSTVYKASRGLPRR